MTYRELKELIEFKKYELRKDIQDAMFQCIADEGVFDFRVVAGLTLGIDLFSVSLDDNQRKIIDSKLRSICNRQARKIAFDRSLYETAPL